jgi:hypothetical protein
MKRYLILSSVLLVLFQTCWAEDDHNEARNFVKEAVLIRLSESTLSKETLSLLLARDSEGHPVSFIPDCPICLGVQDALLAVTPGEEDRNMAAELSVDKASTRTSFLARMVRDAVQEHLTTIESTSERVEMADKLKKASDEGQRQLARYQARKVDTYKMMWSCLMCDAAARAGEDL